MAEWFVSQCDVEKHPKYGIKSLDSILQDLGMDIHRGYQTDGREGLEANKDEVYGNTHRSALTGLVCNGVRYVGEARRDGVWNRFMDRFLNLPLR
jgi:hypothetical protein